MRRVFEIFVLFALFGVGAFAQAGQINGSGKGAAPTLPFRAVLQATADPVFPADLCGTITNTVSGSGTALHLGAFTYTSNETARFDSCAGGVPTSPAITVRGRFTLVAANGDEIQGTFTSFGTLDPVNGLSGTGHYTFVSGTGRFTHVAGGGAIGAQGAAVPPFPAVIWFDGAINYRK